MPDDEPVIAVDDEAANEGDVGDDSGTVAITSEGSSQPTRVRWNAANTSDPCVNPRDASDERLAFGDWPLLAVFHCLGIIFITL